MNGRVVSGRTPGERLTAVAISVLWAKFKEFRSKPTTTRKMLDSFALEEFLDYADLESYMTICFEKEEFAIRLDESSMKPDRFRKQVLRDKLKDASKRVADLNL